MDTELTIFPEPVVDPRGHTLFEPVLLAPRPASLAGKTLLLLDNGKLNPRLGNYRAIFDTIRERLGALLAGVAFVERAEDMLALNREQILALAKDLAGLGADGCVLALGDSGVTQPTVFLATEMERLGVPSLVICNDITIKLAATNVHSYVPGLPLALIRAIRTSSAAAIGRETEGILDVIERGLTATPDKLRDLFAAQFPFTLGVGRDSMAELSPLRLSAGSTASGTANPGDWAEQIYEQFCAAHLTDGLPVIPPTRDRVEAMLRFSDCPRDLPLVAECPPSGAAVTIETIAVNAVMAGCRPEYFPILLAIFEAMAEPRYRLFQAVITSHPGGNAVVVSGPLAREIGLQAGYGCMGPGFRANATIGRAVNLCLLNASRAIPAISKLGTFGSPAEYSYCFAENDELSPWLPFHTECYDAETTTITVHRCESPNNVFDHQSTSPEGLLLSIAAAATNIGANNAYVPSELLVVLNPEHARIIAEAAWTKHDVQAFLYENVRNDAKLLEGRGGTPIRPTWTRGCERMPAVLSPAEVLVFVAGGAGPQSMVAIPWGYSKAVTRPVTHADGTPVRSICEFR